jgi:ABC-2 type transport system ATP-binding protein
VSGPVAIGTAGLGKRYGRRWALENCTLSVPAGRIVGLVGPNGAGKSTLLGLATGLIRPTAGTVTVLGERPGASAGGLARVGFVAQETPVYAHLTVDEHLRLGRSLNPGWDRSMAEDRIGRLQLDPRQKAGRLSGGQRAQLALTLAAAKRPRLLILDEPVAALDPLARRDFLQSLMELVAELEVTVVLSSHLLADLERVCDHLVLLAAGQVQLAGEVESLLASHVRWIGARGEFDHLPDGVELVHASHTARQSTVVARVPDALPHPSAEAERLDLEELVLSYMTRAQAPPAAASAAQLEVHR